MPRTRDGEGLRSTRAATLRDDPPRVNRGGEPDTGGYGSDQRAGADSAAAVEDSRMPSVAAVTASVRSAVTGSSESFVP